SVITSWATEMSAYIKSLDTNHLVALGDEGFLNNGGTTVPYQLLEGVDFAANLGISSLDFGTFHSYPIYWEVTTGYQAWGSQWITDHITLQKSKNKPVILEEYGVSTSDRAAVYAAWWNTIEAGGLSGDLYWQAGTSASGSGYNDGYAIFPADSLFAAVKTHETTMKART
ncbi:glycoside hydrolase, partial [Serendipita vermifera]